MVVVVVVLTVVLVVVVVGAPHATYSSDTLFLVPYVGCQRRWSRHYSVHSRVARVRSVFAGACIRLPRGAQICILGHPELPYQHIKATFPPAKPYPGVT